VLLAKGGGRLAVTLSPVNDGSGGGNTLRQAHFLFHTAALN
jgi:hypothetical protein